MTRKDSTSGNPLGLVLFLFWLHGPRDTLRALGDYFHALADAAEPPQMLTGRRLGSVIGRILLDAEDERGGQRQEGGTKYETSGFHTKCKHCGRYRDRHRINYECP